MLARHGQRTVSRYLMSIDELKSSPDRGRRKSRSRGGVSTAPGSPDTKTYLWARQCSTKRVRCDLAVEHETDLIIVGRRGWQTIPSASMEQILGRSIVESIADHPGHIAQRARPHEGRAQVESPASNTCSRRITRRGPISSDQVGGIGGRWRLARHRSTRAAGTRTRIGPSKRDRRDPGHRAASARSRTGRRARGRPSRVHERRQAHALQTA